MNQKLKKDIPEKKINEVKELLNLLKSKNTILIASIKNLPASQFQEISKKLRGKAIIKVPKKNLIFRAIDESKEDNLIKIKDEIKENSVILFSDMETFELAGELIDNKSPAKAKPGQEAPEDIEIPEGPTELISGPMISEFGSLGIQIKIDKGKIVVKQSKVIAKKGEPISENAASMMSKLDIKPFSVGFVPLSALDTKKGKLYSEININKEEAIEEIKSLFCKSLALAVEIVYVSSDTLSFILGKAISHEKALSSLSEEAAKSAEEETKEETTEEKKEEDNQTPEEKSDDHPKVSEGSSEPSGEK